MTIYLITCVCVQMSTSASLVMEDVNITVLTLRENSSVLVELDIVWTVMNLTVEVRY